MDFLISPQRKLQEKIEEVQLENKSLKSRNITVDNERGFINKVRVEIGMVTSCVLFFHGYRTLYPFTVEIPFICYCWKYCHLCNILRYRT